MKRYFSFVLTVLMVLSACVALFACNGSKPLVDYVAECKLDEKSAETVKMTATVKTYIDGDTTHFYVDSSVIPGGVLKARYLAINTPESTGKIEPWGQKASDFTKSKLKSAVSIILESDNNKWNIDSTGGRYLVWVWYKPSADADYRNLNIEILQEGLAVSSKADQNRYGDICSKAIYQASEHKLYVYSNAKDPDFYDGDVMEVTIKGLRQNIESYNGVRVAFQGDIVSEASSTIYVQDYDEDTEMYYGMTIFYGYGMDGAALRIMKPGNRIRISGVIKQFQSTGNWQMSDVKYDAYDTDNIENLKLIKKDVGVNFIETSPERFLSTVKVEINGEEGEYKYAALALDTGISMTGLKITDVYTTKNESSSSKGAMTITCTKDGKTITIRTNVLYDENNNLITAASYPVGSIINVKGIVGYYNPDKEDETAGGYQIRVFTPANIEVVQ